MRCLAGHGTIVGPGGGLVLALITVGTRVRERRVFGEVRPVAAYSRCTAAPVENRSSIACSSGLPVVSAIPPTGSCST